MANYCDFEMRIKGRKLSIKKLAEWMSAQYDYNCNPPKVVVAKNGIETPTDHHLGWRVFNFNIDEDTLNDCDDATDAVISGWGYCAWSTYSCMLEGENTFYSENHRSRSFSGKVIYSISLPKACKELQIEIELYSYEPGFEFAEHYRISSDGKMIVSEVTDYHEYYIGENVTYEDYVKSNMGDAATREEFDAARNCGDSYVIRCDWITNGSDWPFTLS